MRIAQKSLFDMENDGRSILKGMTMKLDEAISIITCETYRPDRVEESCLFIVEEARKIAGTIAVEKAEFMNTLDYGIVFNRERKAIRVDPIVFGYNLRDHHKATGISYEKLLWRSVEHEKGHFELQQHGLQPLLPRDRTYMTLYGRFEDYAISRFLRSGEYVEVERAVLRAESRRDLHTFNDLCVEALCVALGYVELKELEIPPKFGKYVHLISVYMNAVKQPKDVPELVRKLSLKLADENLEDLFSL